MTLGFKTKFDNGKPTLFVNKIWAGFLKDRNNYVIDKFPLSQKKCNLLKEKFADAYFNVLLKNIDVCDSDKPKIHTIRADPKRRWKAGNLIHFVIGNRTKNRFQFAPVLPCVSVQKIQILNESYLNGDGKMKNVKTVYVDGEFLEYEEYKELAINDGFESVAEFDEYFKEDFEGVIIHWTDKRY